MKSNRTFRAGSGIAALALLAGVLAAGPAGAAATHVRDAIAARSHTSVLSPTDVHPNTAATREGAGFYSYPGGDNIASVSVTFTMPSSISCYRDDDSEWLAPGIWIYDDDAFLEQFSGVKFSCQAGVLTLVDALCVNDSYGGKCDSSLTVNLGDRVVASVYESRVQTVSAVHDLTTGGRSSVAGAITGNDVTVFIGDQGPAYAPDVVATHVPTFSTVQFTKAQVNGQYLRDWSPTHYNLATAGSVQVKTGLLTGGGDTFITTFVRN